MTDSTDEEQQLTESQVLVSLINILAIMSKDVGESSTSNPVSIF